MPVTTRSDEGAIAIVVAAFAVAMFGFAAIVVDLGDARALRVQAVNAADAAALAGANEIADQGGGSGSDAMLADVVKASVAKNTGQTDWAKCPLAAPPAGWSQAAGGGPCIAVRYGGTGPEQVRVTLPTQRSVAGLGAIFGFSGIDVTATTQAQVRREPVPDCGLCVLSTANNAFDTRGPVVVNGGDSFAAYTGRVRGAGSLTVAAPGVLTFATKPNPATGPYSPSPERAIPNDPLSGAARPAVQGAPAPNRVTCDSGGAGVSSLGPAVYRNIDVTGPCTATGTLTVTGLLRITNSGSLTGFNATVYLCDPSTGPAACTRTGRLLIDAGGSMAFGGSSPGFSVVADPGNAQVINVNGTADLSQALYAPSARLSIGSAGSLGVGSPFSGSGARAVVGRLSLLSGGQASVYSDGRSQVAGPIDVRLARVAP